MTGERQTPRRPRRRPGENRERLILAGIIEFGLLGYQRASTSAIAVRAGVPQPHVYASFGSKQELFIACCRRTVELLLTGAPVDEPLPPQAAQRLLYQAVAALGDAELGGLIGPEIAPLRRGLGEQAFLQLLSAGAAALLPPA